MTDLYLLDSEKTKLTSYDELTSLVTSAPQQNKAEMSSLLESLNDPNISPQQTIERSRDVAQAVSQQMKAMKVSPTEFKAVLNDIPAHARGPLEDALKAVNVTPAYIAPTEKAGFDVVQPLTERPGKRADSVPHSKDSVILDLRKEPDAAVNGGQQPFNDTEARLDKLAGPELAHARGANDIRTTLDKMADAVKADFEQRGVPEGSRSVVIDAPAHLTGAMESAMERKGIAVLHAEFNGKVTEAASGLSGAEQRGMQAVRKAMGESKGLSDSAIRQELGSERLQSIGQNPKSLSEEKIAQVMNSRQESITDVSPRIAAVFEAARELPALEKPSQAQQKEVSPGVFENVESRTASVEKPSEPTTLSTRTRDEGRGDPLPPEKLGARLVQSYIMSTNHDTMKLDKGSKVSGVSMYIAVPGKYDNAPSEKYIAQNLGNDTLKDFAKNGIPHRELDAIANVLRTQANVKNGPAPDRLDAVHLREIAMNVRESANTRIEHNGQQLCTVSELRQELAKVNNYEAQARAQLKDVLPEKDFEKAFKQLKLETVKDIARNGVDQPLVQQLKTQMAQKNPDNPNWFKTEDSLNAITAAKEGRGRVLEVSQSFEGKKEHTGFRWNNVAYAKEGDEKGRPNMLSMNDVYSEMGKAVTALGREKEWNKRDLDYNRPQPEGMGNAPNKTEPIRETTTMEGSAKTLLQDSASLEKSEKLNSPSGALAEKGSTSQMGITNQSSLEKENDRSSSSSPDKENEKTDANKENQKSQSHERQRER